MKKSLLAVAVLGAFAGAASAQSSLTLFGTVDVAIERSTTKSAAGVSVKDTTLKNNRRGTSQLSVRGVEDLGGGTAAIFLWEGDFDATQQATNHPAGAGGGEVFVGLRGGFGQVRLGSVNTPTLSSQAARQPFGTKLGSGFGTNVMSTAQVRQNNSIRYDTPTMGGLTVSLDVAAANDNATKGRVMDLGVNYAAGPVNAWGTYYKQKVTGTKILELVGSVAFGPAKVFLGYGKESSDTGGANNKNYNIAAAIGVAPNLSILANFGKLDDTNATDTDKKIFAIGPDYALSKRSFIYARYVSEKNSGKAVTGAATKSVATMLAGMQHNF